MKGKLKILHISDTHNKHKQIKWPIHPAEMDVIVHSGDMSAVGAKGEVQNFFKWFKELPVKYKVLIAGNHDKCFDPQVSEEWREHCLMPHWLYKEIFDFEASGYHNYYLENNGCEIEGIQFWGSPISPIFGNGWAFNRNRGLDIGDYWLDIPMDTDVLVTHGPAYGFVDWGEQHNGPLGCEQLRYAIKARKPLLHLCGHIHEAHGYTYDADTNYFNGSICTLHGYNPIQSPWYIDCDFSSREIKILNDVKGEKDKDNEAPSNAREGIGEL